MTNTRYGTLFTIELLHKYFTDQLCNDFSIVPTAVTQQVLGSHGIHAKQYGNKLYAGLSLNKDSLKLMPPLLKPFTVPEEGM